MNIKKVLKEDSANVSKQILQEGQGSYTALSQKHCVQSNGVAVIRSKSNKNTVLITLACLLICIITAGILWVSLTKSKQPEYFKENELTADIELEDIYNNIENKININTSEYVIVATKKTYDSISLDDLYFSIEIKDNLKLLNGFVYIVPNTNYNFTKQYPAEPLQTVWKDLPIQYASKSHKLDIFTTNEVFGCLEYKNLKFYFSYEQIDLDGASNPIQFLDSILILK